MLLVMIIAANYWYFIMLRKLQELKTATIYALRITYYLQSTIKKKILEDPFCIVFIGKYLITFSTVGYYVLLKTL